MKSIAHFAALILILASAQAATSVVGKVPGWTIAKSTDAMSDKTSCSAIYEKSPAFSMDLDRVFISMKSKGGVRAYQFRFDSEPPTTFADRMPSDSADYWWLGDIDRVLAAKKLLVRIKPLIGDITDFEIDLTGAKAARVVLLSSKCQL